MSEKKKQEYTTGGLKNPKDVTEQRPCQFCGSMFFQT